MNTISERSNGKGDRRVQDQGNTQTANGGRDIEIGQGSQNRIESSHLFFCVDKAIIVESILTRLFRRSTEHDSGATTISNLRDLWSFALSHKFFYEIVFGPCYESGKSVGGYLQDLVSYYIKKEVFFEECFRMCVEDGIKILMLKGCEDKEAYLAMLTERFQKDINEYLNMGDDVYAVSMKHVEITIETLSAVIKIKEGHALLNEILISLCKELSNKLSEPTKKIRVLNIIKLVVYRCLDAENNNLIGILEGVKGALSYEEGNMVENAIIAIAKLAEGSLLKGIEPEMLKCLVVSAKGLLNYEKLNVISAALYAIGQFAEAGLLKKVEPKVIEGLVSGIESLVKVEGFSDANEAKMVQYAIIAIGKLAAANLLNEGEPKVLERLVIKMTSLASAGKPTSKTKSLC